MPENDNFSSANKCRNQNIQDVNGMPLLHTMVRLKVNVLPRDKKYILTAAFNFFFLALSPGAMRNIETVLSLVLLGNDDSP